MGLTSKLGNSVKQTSAVSANPAGLAGLGLDAIQRRNTGPNFLGSMSDAAQRTMAEGMDSVIGKLAGRSPADILAQRLGLIGNAPQPGHGPFIFPLDMEFGRPLVVFTIRNKNSPDDQQKIQLPIPGGVTFSDAGTYSSVDLGTIGNAANALKNTGEEVGDAAGSGNFIGLIKQKLSNINGFKVGEIAAELAAGGAMGQSAQSAAFLVTSGRKILNPNTNTTFTSNSVRSFKFSFTMVSRSEKESIRIRDIHNLIRRNAYPDSTVDDANVILDYPAIWTIHFENQDVHKYLPYIYPCYLTQLETNFNPSASMYHTNRAPVEVSIGLTFQETRALIRTDIEKMEAGKSKPNFDL